MNYLKRVLKGFLSQNFINNFYHLPKAVLANMFYSSPTFFEIAKELFNYYKIAPTE